VITTPVPSWCSSAACSRRRRREHVRGVVRPRRTGRPGDGRHHRAARSARLMLLQHLPDGRIIGDTQLMAALTGRPPATVRVHCPRHELGYDVRECEAILHEADDPVLLTARQAEQYLAIPAGTVRAWACRGALRSRDHNPAGRPLYD